MSNFQLTLVALAALLSHVLALATALVRRHAEPAFVLNLAVAGVALIALAQDLRWLRAPIDQQIVGLVVLEVVVLLMAGLALRGRHRAAIVGSWIAFGLNFLASGLAVIFVFTFKITRLI